ncbi:hypothetical protein CHS0354_011738 [Potamilus streckersoni]|uniref:Uncharacterized protein n=1 Tax=Potamilus streckersoni TaxID=2493646 RepID=A0AAE0SJL1_9BIVA|nr:hypothetical protein CHS0354_011738 [Potamilus streckersoni]
MVESCNSALFHHIFHFDIGHSESYGLKQLRKNLLTCDQNLTLLYNVKMCKVWQRILLPVKVLILLLVAIVDMRSVKSVAHFNEYSTGYYEMSHLLEKDENVIF